MTTKTPYDPKLRLAAEEIKEILKKYDCMGFTVLASPTNSEFIFEPATTWSVCRWEGSPTESGLRFRSKREDFASKEAQDTATAATVHGLESCRWLAERFNQDLGRLVDELRKRMTIITNVAGMLGKPDSVPGDGK